MQSNAHVTSGPRFLTTFSAKRDHRLVCDSQSRKAKSRPVARRNRREARRALREIAQAGGGDFLPVNTLLTGREIA
jgi:hypothetical protein